MESLKIRSENLNIGVVEQEAILRKYYVQFFNDAALFEETKPSRFKSWEFKSEKTIKLRKKNEPNLQSMFGTVAEDNKDQFLGRSNG